MGVPKDYTGKKYGMLTPIQRLGKSKNGYYIWLCKCDCGNMVERTVDVFNRGKSSCGCASKRNRYDSFCKRHNGTKHILKDAIKDRNGNYRDDVIYEIVS